MKAMASSIIADYKLNASHSTLMSESNSQSGDAQTITNVEYFWRRVNNANQRFSEHERFSWIFAKSLNLYEVCTAYLTYCNRKDFSRFDRVKLLSLVLNGPALKFWIERINEKAELIKLGAVFWALKN